MKFSIPRIKTGAWAAPRSALAVVQCGQGLLLASVARVEGVVSASHATFVPLPLSADAENMAQTVAQAVASWGPVERVALAVDGSRVTLRNFSFPFGGRRQIHAVLPQEMAQNSLLPPEQFCLALGPITHQDDGRYAVQVAAFNKAEAGALVRAFSEQGLPLYRLYPAWACLAPAWKLYGQATGAVCVLDSDPARDLCVLLLKGQTHSVLCYSPPPPPLTPSQAAAERTARQGSLDKPAKAAAGTDHEKNAAHEAEERAENARTLKTRGATAGSCSDRIRLLGGRAGMFLEGAPQVDALVLTGHCASSGHLGPDHLGQPESAANVVPDYAPALEEFLALPVHKLDCPAEAIYGGEPQLRSPAVALALAQSLVGAISDPGMNFLSGELAPASGRPLWQRAARAACAALCVLTLSLCVLAGAQGLRASRAQRPLQQELFKSYREVLPDASPATPLLQMQRIVEARLKEWHVSAQPVKDHGTTLGLLSALHQALPPSLDVRLEHLSINKERVTMTGSVPEFKTADTLRETLLSLPAFADMQLKSATRGEAGRVRFELEGKLRVAP